jgi:hypothetical protein
MLFVLDYYPWTERGFQINILWHRMLNHEMSGSPPPMVWKTNCLCLSVCSLSFWCSSHSYVLYVSWNVTRHTNSMDHNSSWEANTDIARWGISHILCTSEFHDWLISPLACTLSQMNPSTFFYIILSVSILVLSSHLCCCHPCGPILYDLPTKTLYVFLYHMSYPSQPSFILPRYCLVNFTNHAALHFAVYWIFHSLPPPPLQIFSSQCSFLNVRQVSKVEL